jgi:hypothetical protein
MAAITKVSAWYDFISDLARASSSDCFTHSCCDGSPSGPQLRGGVRVHYSTLTGLTFEISDADRLQESCLIEYASSLDFGNSTVSDTGYCQCKAPDRDRCMNFNSNVHVLSSWLSCKRLANERTKICTNFPTPRKVSLHHHHHQKHNHSSPGPINTSNLQELKRGCTSCSRPSAVDSAKQLFLTHSRVRTAWTAEVVIAVHP